MTSFTAKTVNPIGIFIKHYYFRYIMLFFSSMLLLGCLSTPNEDIQAKARTQRATLADLAAQRSSKQNITEALNKQQRAKKLAAIYQSILTLEPDAEIRTNVEYRLAQINTQRYENYGDEHYADEELNTENIAKSEQQLQQLINEYRDLLQRYPNRANNEFVQYQLAKALDLQGKTAASLVQINSLLTRYPNSTYNAELNFRRGDIYYNLQNYNAALTAYKKVISSNNNDKYLLNSLYMSGWSLFKLNRLADADMTFIQVFEAIIAQNKPLPTAENFSFNSLTSRGKSLAKDTQRVLSISLSQQQQATSLVKLVKNNRALTHLALYQHLLFKNLANFLLKNELPHDAILTYQAYIALAPNSLWAARFSLSLLTLYQQQGQFSLIDKLKNNFVNRYGMGSVFWQQASIDQQNELLPHLVKFSYAHSHRLYAKAQQLALGQSRIKHFKQAAIALHTYLIHARSAQEHYSPRQQIQHDLLHNEYLYAEANFEAQQYQQALTLYQTIAYHALKKYPLANELLEKKEQHTDPALLKSWRQLQRKAAYASTVTVRKLLTNYYGDKTAKNLKYQQLIKQRNDLDKRFVIKYLKDNRALVIASQAIQYSFASEDYAAVNSFSDFILKHYHVNQQQLNKTSLAIKRATKLSAKALKQINIASQLQAHSLYKQKRYQEAELAYDLAMNYVNKQQKTWIEIRNLIASCIYFQGQALKVSQPQLAVQHFLRLGKVIPESSYRVTAEFDAANLLLAQQHWQQAVKVLLAFKQRYPKHQYSRSIPAKLAKSYTGLKQWDLAAEQLLIMVNTEPSNELRREAQYTAAEYYLKAGNKTKALSAFRTYAHTYPKPFAIAQEVRYKMSTFYQQSKEANKRYYWYRKILKFHVIEQRKSLAQITPRTIFLASSAAFSLGQAHQQSFKWVKLKAPLKTSLKRKQREMKKAIGYYQQVLAFKLANFVPHTTYNLAMLYQQLAQDVLNSERPANLDELALEEYDLVLEELAYPFEEKAIDIHASNTQRAWQNIYDQWVGKSFAALAKLSPALYDRKEHTPDVINAIY